MFALDAYSYFTAIRFTIPSSIKTGRSECFSNVTSNRDIKYYMTGPTKREVDIHTQDIYMAQDLTAWVVSGNDHA